MTGVHLRLPDAALVLGKMLPAGLPCPPVLSLVGLFCMENTGNSLPGFQRTAPGIILHPETGVPSVNSALCPGALQPDSLITLMLPPSLAGSFPMPCPPFDLVFSMGVSHSCVPGDS